METYTNVSYSQHIKGNNEVSTQIKYDISQIDKDKLFNTSYTKKLEPGMVSESFNKLFKQNEDTYQQIGNSKNGQKWQIKEFDNNNLKKEYSDDYRNHIFDENLIEKSQYVIKNIGKLGTKYITN